MRAIALLRRLSVIGALLLVAGALSACGHKEANPTTGDNEGPYVRAGNISYQVQLSRQLNPFSSEDRGYLTGVDSASVKPSQMWFVVFLLAKNETHSNLTTSGSFDIVDTDGNRYYPVRLNASLNPYAWTPQSLRPLGTEPAADTTAAFGPTQGSELLFKLDNTVYSNRPATFEIHAAGQAAPSSVSLDL
ncbi:MAG: hypothetical protein M3Z27_02785 [Actinomycetota bacterium]|nr:hypothetical protein [Actinomycetota bacterium]